MLESSTLLSIMFQDIYSLAEVKYQIELLYSIYLDCETTRRDKIADRAQSNRFLFCYQSSRERAEVKGGSCRIHAQIL